MSTLETWQLVRYCVGSGTSQMALDERLLNWHSQNPETPSILRFYTWSPAAISLGYHQRQVPSHWSNLAQNFNLDVVRRPSGGRAVLHKGDLTYAVITKAGNTNRRAIYEYICEFLIQGFAQLGIKLRYGQQERGYIRNPSCFSTATGADLVINDGRKLIGSAQVYRHGSVLQHGAIALQPDHQLLQKLFNTAVPVVGLCEIGSAPGWVNFSDDLIAQLVQILTNAASKHFQAEFINCELDSFL